MGLLSAFSNNPQFQKQLADILQQQSPGYTGAQFIPPPSMMTANSVGSGNARGGGITPTSGSMIGGGATPQQIMTAQGLQPMQGFGQSQVPGAQWLGADPAATTGQMTDLQRQLMAGLVR